MNAIIRSLISSSRTTASAPGRSLHARRFVGRFGVALGLLLTPFLVHADVSKVADTHFTSNHSLQIDAPSVKVWRSLTREVSRWWNPVHSYSGEARNFRLQAEAGGCFCERLQSGGSVEHMRVVFVQPGKELRMVGGLGPLQAMPVSGVMLFKLSAIETKGEPATQLEYIYRVSSAAGGLEAMAEPVDKVQLDQLTRLKHWLEKRNPNWPALNKP